MLTRQNYLIDSLLFFGKGKSKTTVQIGTPRNKYKTSTAIDCRKGPPCYSVGEDVGAVAVANAQGVSHTRTAGLARNRGWGAGQASKASGPST